jgi:hypothetical protein
MPNLTFDFTWYKDSKGYSLAGTKPPPKGQSILDMPAKPIHQPLRIVRNGGKRLPYQPLEIGDLFERFSRVKTEGDVLKFVETYGPLTLGGSRGKGDIVEDVRDEARHMRSRVSKALGKLNVTIDSIGDETQLRVRPACLLDALWLQYAQANTRSRECPQCHERFLVGVEAGRRADAKFCSAECQKKFNSLKRSRRWGYGIGS